MLNEVEILNKYIRSNYKSQDEFAKSIGMTRQNLNYLVRNAKQNNGIFKYDFHLKLQMYGINILQPVKGVSLPQKTTKVHAHDEVYELMDNVIKSQKETINALNHTIESLQREIQRLQQQLEQTAVHQQHGTGRRRSA